MSSSKPPSRPPPRRPRVLVVDDEPLLLRSLGRVLAKEADVTLAETADEALSLIEDAGTFDVVISDLMMPGRSGIALYHDLRRARPQLAETMMFMTGGMFTEEAKRFRDEVDNEFIPKPVDPFLLRRRLRRVCC